MAETRIMLFDSESPHWRVETIPLPEPTGSEVLVEVIGSTICGSDLHTVFGRRQVPVPTILGHEVVGRVVKMGPTAQRSDYNQRPLQVGTTVVWPMVAPCGRCEECIEADPQRCRKPIKYGHERWEPGKPPRGGFAEHCLLTGETQLLSVPPYMPLEMACVLGCATATAVAALADFDDFFPLEVGILGGGMLGLSACAMLLAVGAKVTLFDPIEQRRAIAEKWGARTPLDLDAWRSHSLSQSGEGKLDAVFDFTGKPGCLPVGLSVLRRRGTLVLVGNVYPAGMITIDPEQIVRREITIQGRYNYKFHHLMQAINFVQEFHQQFPMESLVERWFPIMAIDEAFAAAASGRFLRVGVRPSFE